MKPTLSALVVVLLAGTLLTSHLPAQSGTETTSIFSAVPTPNNKFNNILQAASASSANDIWAVGETTIHFDGMKWTAFIPADNKNLSSLGGVVAISPTLAWAAGSTQNSSTGQFDQVIEQWNGTRWRTVKSPTFGEFQEPSLMTMTSTGPDDIWAIGDLLDNDANQLFFLFEHWDGKSWTATTSLSGDAFLLNASADATNDGWAVGFNGPENDDSRTLAMHWDGKSWTAAKTPSVGSGANQLNGVLALAPDDVWAVGFSTSAAPPKEVPTHNLIEHFDGKHWKVVKSPNVGPASQFQSNRLFGLTANSPTDIWAFGSYFAADGSGQQMTLLLHWDGMNWTIAPSPNPSKGGFVSDLLFAGVVPSPGNVWIFGAEDDAPHEDTLAIHTLTGSKF